jgi:hypothetical protein
VKNASRTGSIEAPETANGAAPDAMTRGGPRERALVHPWRYLTTDDVQRAMPLVRKEVAALGFEGDTLIDTSPVDEDDGDTD